MGTRGVVVSGHHAASDAGLTILKAGGNAVDAGIATVFAQTVTEFDRFGFGGEVPILIYSAEKKKVFSINGHGQAPAKANLEWFQQRNIDAIPGDCFLPATVPAVLGSLIKALDELGSMSLAEVLAPAIYLADKGFPAASAGRQSIIRAPPAEVPIQPRKQPHTDQSWMSVYRC